MRKKLLILTKSSKRCHDGTYGKCVAGIVRGANGSYEWVRLVADQSGDSLPDGSFPYEPLDIVDIDISPCPRNNHIENYTYTSPQKISTITLDQLKSVFRRMPHSFFGSMSGTFNGTPSNSLTIFLATNIRIYRRSSDRKQRMDFHMGNNTATDISMTDPRHYTSRDRDEEKRIPLAICVASLPDHPAYNKFIASVFPIDRYEPNYK